MVTAAVAIAGGSRPDRGQLLLAGSVVLAVTVLGVAVLLNAAMYADAARSGGRPGQSVTSAETYERTVSADLHRLVNATDGEAALRANVTTYADRLGTVAAHSDGAVVDVRLVAVSPGTYSFRFAYDTPELTYRTTIAVPRTQP